MHKYAVAAHDFVDELKAMLQNEDINALRDLLGNEGRDAWVRWFHQHRADIAAYAAATPAARLRKKGWQDPELRRRLTFGALWMMQLGGQMLQLVDNNQCIHSPGAGYRQTVTQAALARLELFSQRIDEWPFGGQSPFEKSS